jgi:hypothetical protein
VDLTPDETTVLLIAAKGEPMMPIGRWSEPTKSLVAKGLLKPRKHEGDPTGHFNNYITFAGQKVAADLDKQEDQALADVINLSRGITHTQNKAAAHAEQIVVQLADLATMSSQVTGDDKVTALRNWARVILERALGMMK